ncbi:PREDICTED: uncharacterized protein LOC104725197 [Camelina sativa]|uniref:Uncharacterized protein LOC104725197 n=1 Tax=Camelina sativa TaxID=90675 RepID=A0ABM0UJM4_CAMSA|nr:PREDICTED: uncharacterized protein LOC104725197 [Camelina sativa]
MKGRAYVMIFFFWALLTIITPMLISWSQSLKNLPTLSDDQEKKIKESSPRRMMGYTEEMHLAQEFVSRVEEEKLVMEPSMAPTPEDKPVMPSLSFARLEQHEGLVAKDAHPMSLRQF